MLSNTPPPPYYAVIFSSLRTNNDNNYAETNAHMNQLALKQDGFLGMEDASSEISISISYWRDLEAIKTWKENLAHKDAQEKGRQLWYQQYKVRIAFVEHEYEFLKK
jgi:heme-degrading monooxygenase HmoA